MMIFCLVIVECNPLIFNYKGTKKIFDISKFKALILNVLHKFFCQ